MKIDVQFGDKFTVDDNGTGYQYRDDKWKLLGGADWHPTRRWPSERDIPYSLFKQIALAAGHEIVERVVCYRTQEMDSDRIRVWPDGSWCHVYTDGTVGVRIIDTFNLTGFTSCDDAPLAKPEAKADNPQLIAPATATEERWEIVHTSGKCRLFTTREQAENGRGTEKRYWSAPRKITINVEVK